jgi:monovalent cation:H+ antiporter, CPA1 family
MFENEAERLSKRDHVAIALVALDNQERVLVLETRADQIASPPTVQLLLRYTDALVEGARADGRLGYQRAVKPRSLFRPRSV